MTGRRLFLQGAGAAVVLGFDPVGRNRRLFERARRVGGTRYPISAIPFSRGDWVRQYDGVYPDLVRAKRRFDPDGILTPGPGIF